MEKNYEYWALIDEEKHIGSIWPGKPIKEDGAWILGDQFINMPYEMVQRFAKDVLGREMIEADNPLDLTNYFNKRNEILQRHT